MKQCYALYVSLYSEKSLIKLIRRQLRIFMLCTCVRGTENKIVQNTVIVKALV